MRFFPVPFRSPTPPVTWTFNSSYKGADITLDAAKTTATFTVGTQEIVIATAPGSTTGKSTGKWYWEFVISSGGGAATDCGIISGLSPSTYNQHLGADSHGYAYYSTAGGLWLAGSLNFNVCGTSYWSVNGNVIGLALNATANQVTVYLNNVNQCTFAVAGGNYFPAMSSVQFMVMKGNFSTGSFTYTPPVGYIALN